MLSKRSMEMCWLLIIDARCRKVRIPRMIFLQVFEIPPEDVTLRGYQADSWAVGVECEEAGEKWRAGDKKKSLRFFARAIDAYDTGLQKFPRSFDLIYNK